ncbi:MAG: fibronectin type III domain-containing protein, partial [Flavobacterium sp.]
IFNVCEEKTISLPISTFNTPIYIAFVREFTQPSASYPAGDTFFIDKVEVIEQCLVPTGLTATSITATTAQLSWTPPGSADIEMVIGAAAPTGIPTHTNQTSPFNITNLLPNTTYRFFVRSICANGPSAWSPASSNFTTQLLPPVCGGNFVDNGGPTANYSASADVTTTICPVNAGDVVQVQFTAFQTEVNFDALYIFDGNSITAPQITSANPPANVPGGLAGGFW